MHAGKMGNGVGEGGSSEVGRGKEEEEEHARMMPRRRRGDCSQLRLPAGGV
jgi:hypothetical protein